MLLITAVSNKKSEDYDRFRCVLCRHISHSMLGAARHLRVQHPVEWAEYQETRGITPQETTKREVGA